MSYQQGISQRHDEKPYNGILQNYKKSKRKYLGLGNLCLYILNLCLHIHKLRTDAQKKTIGVTWGKGRETKAIKRLRGRLYSKKKNSFFNLKLKEHTNIKINISELKRKKARC